MKSLHVEIAIGAPTSIVWSVISDLDGWATWNPVMKASGKLELGSQVDVSIAAPGGEGLSFTPKVVMFEDGKEFHWRTKKMLGLFDALHGFRVIADQSGGCTFEQFEEFRGPMGQAMYKRQSKALNMGFVAMNRMLKRECEKRAREQS